MKFEQDQYCYAYLKWQLLMEKKNGHKPQFLYNLTQKKPSKHPYDFGCRKDDGLYIQHYGLEGDFTFES